MEPSCSYENQELVSPKLLLSMGIAPGSLYESEDVIIRIAQKAREGGGYVALPFCHTTEAKALGADITPADETAGPRPGRYTCENLSQIPTLPLAQDPEISRLLRACGRLHEAGDAVAYQITGPISLLSCLMDLSVLFKTWRKEPDTVAAAWERLRAMMLDYVSAICAAGADYISYADPAGNGDILGPRYTRLLTEGYTLPFLRSAAERCGADTTLVICPLTASALTASGALQPAGNSTGEIACGCIKSGQGGFQRRLRFS